MSLERKENIIKINSVTELNVEDAIEYAKNGVKAIIIKSAAHPTKNEITSINSSPAGYWQQKPYDIREYIQIREALDELVEDIPKDSSELEKFATIYKRIGKNIVYDDAAAYPKSQSERDYSEENKFKCRNLSNGLLEGKCVCAGYSDILCSALDLVGIEARYVQGPIIKEKKKNLKEMYDRREEILFEDKEISDYHAWAKVKIDGIWYNSEPTWDASNIRNDKAPKKALHTDKEAFIDGKVDNPGPECITEFPKKELDKLFGEKYIGNFKLPNVKGLAKEVVDAYVSLFKDSKRMIKNFMEKITKKDLPLLEGGTSQSEIDTCISLLQDKKFINEFEQETGYTIKQLQNMGLSINEIASHFPKYNTETGELLNRKNDVSLLVENQKNRIIELQEETGYSLEGLIALGIDSEKISQLFNKTDPQTGEKINRKERIANEINFHQEKVLQKEIGYSLDTLRQLGFSNKEIMELRDKNFDTETGERIDKKKEFQEILKGKYDVKDTNTIEYLKKFGVKEEDIRIQSKKEELKPWDLRNWGVDIKTMQKRQKDVATQMQLKTSKQEKDSELER